MAHLERDASRTDELILLILALSAIAGSFILQPNDAGGLNLPIPLIGTQISLPEVCMSRKTLGISCPGCGLTRSFVSTAHGNFAPAFRWNPMGPLLFVVVLFQIPYRAIEYLGLWRSSPLWMRFKDGLAYAAWPICGGLVVAWVIRMVY